MKRDAESPPALIPLPSYKEYPAVEMRRRSLDFHEAMRRRRSVRDFSDRVIPEGVLENCLRAAGTSPSGANMQPWHFVVVKDAGLKARIRLAAEQEEREFYERRAPEEWLEALAPLGTDWRKTFLETAPCLIVIFGQTYGETADGGRIKHYYVQESVGIATGILIAGLHLAGLATLTHTPSPMKFLNEILGRPQNERPFLILVAGYPADGAMVPAITRKSLEEFATFR